VAAGVAIICMIHASSAGATGSTCSDGAFARTVGERVLVAWDPTSKTEHVILQVRLQSDAQVHAIVMPMPNAPVATGGYSIEDEILFGRLESLMRYEPAEIPDAPELETLPRSTARVVMATVFPQASSLPTWLEQEKLAKRPALLAWATRYEKRGWTLDAVRLAEDDVAAGTMRILQSPPVRFSFHTDAPFVPYTESPPDEADVAKHGNTPRSMDVWVIAPTPVDLVQADTAQGRAVLADALVRKNATRVTAQDLDATVGRIGPFDPKARPVWYVTRFAERGPGPRIAFDDLAIVPGSRGATHARAEKHRMTRRTKALFGLGLLLVAAIVGAFLAQRQPSSP
jgi:hypothetical protein